ncbi:pyridoxal phosphate-dependent transferase [Mycena maculata]|uniref:phosphoserine transaminase n=1 Tax=Mycena maculata TaxID=230809 RepID=A0AAD7J9V0_9AGAR|nr:pyridoxal phosphate-dependent transferase [Mycena maculata]
MPESRVINLSAGPCSLPEPVLHEAAKGLLNFNGTGIGIAEVSHRSKEFHDYLVEVEGLIRTQLGVPETHSILFAQGGGALQFSAIVLNLLARHRLLHPDLPDAERVMDYVVTGWFSEIAVGEAGRLGGGEVNVVVDSRSHSKDGKTFDNIPPHEAYRGKFSPDPALIFYCDNETIDGVGFSDDTASPTSFPFHLLPKDPKYTLLPLVGDYSSSFMSRPIPHLADHAIIFASAQKNIGPAGVTVLIVRKDCLVDVDAAAKLGAAPVPYTMAYKTLSDNFSLYNTPSVLAIYITGLVLRRSQELGGVKYYEGVNKRKADKLYSVIKEGEAKGVLQARVKEGSGRSLMNVVFDFGDRDMQAKFVSGAEARGIKGIKGHPYVCTRLSIYNAVTEEQVDTVVAYMKDFLASA